MADLIEGIQSDQLGLSTPCADWDVTALLGHVVLGTERVAVIGHGGDPGAASPSAAEETSGGWAVRYAKAVEELWSVWEDDALLDREIMNPWGPMSGKISLLSYTFETLAHGWDLATATGQNAEAPAEVAGPALAIAKQAIPAEPRGGPVPFSAPAPIGETAGATRQLAAWLGRS
jgi:uncharacterized protein (TIGR03086 family)